MPTKKKIARFERAILDSIPTNSVSLDRNGLILEQCPVQIAELIADVACVVQDKLDAKGLQLHVVAREMPSRLLGDSTRIRQALLNCVANAVKFTNNGSIGLRASIVKNSLGSAILRIEVQDSGIGTTAATTSKIFNPFVQADSSTTRKHGGTTFWFTVKLMKATAIEVAASETLAQNAALALKEEYAGRRVLLAEDGDSNREIGSIPLQDIGLDVARTANAFHEDKRRCMQSGKDDFFTKPIDPSQIYPAILRLFEESRPLCE